MDKRVPIIIIAIAIVAAFLFLYKAPTEVPTEEAPAPIIEENTPEEPVVTEDPYAEARSAMVRKQLKKREITDAKVLEAMGKIKRHEFVPDSQRSAAYEDHPLPIGEGQTISQPYIVALMTQSLNLSGDERVLEIGTGSGYQAAVLAEIVDEVYTIEIIEVLAERAEKTLQRLYENVRVKNADGYYGWDEYAPFDAIIVTAAANHVPPSLLEQLKDGGLLIIPLGSQRYYQTLTLVKKVGDEAKTTYVTGVRFVPMTGKALEG